MNIEPDPKKKLELYNEYNKLSLMKFVPPKDETAEVKKPKKIE